MTLMNLFDHCTLCPRECGVNRNKGQRGYCRTGAELLVARAALHMWEEPCLSGKRGSGTVFFAGCAMGCVFCQNHDIARGERGKIISVERLSAIFLELQEKGAHNINLVTPSHYVPPIALALRRAKTQGLNIPVVFNSSGYEKRETLALLEGLVDIYLPDFKYWDPAIARRYSQAPDYAAVAKEALAEMLRQTGMPQYDEEGMLLRGTIVRHLSLPGSLGDSKDILEYLKDTYGGKITVSIMNQYTPMPAMGNFPEINRKVTPEEYEELVGYAQLLGLKNAFIQEEGTQSDSFIPPFDLEGV